MKKEERHAARETDRQERADSTNARIVVESDQRQRARCKAAHIKPGKMTAETRVVAHDNDVQNAPYSIGATLTTVDNNVVGNGAVKRPMNAPHIHTTSPPTPSPSAEHTKQRLQPSPSSNQLLRQK